MKKNSSLVVTTTIINFLGNAAFLFWYLNSRPDFFIGIILLYMSIWMGFMLITQGIQILIIKPFKYNFIYFFGIVLIGVDILPFILIWLYNVYF